MIYPNTAISIVMISFFKPEGYEDTHYVQTQNRWEAVQTVVSHYSPDQMAYLNYVEVTIRGSQDHMKFTEKVNGPDA